VRGPRSTHCCGTLCASCAPSSSAGPWSNGSCVSWHRLPSTPHCRLLFPRHAASTRYMQGEDDCHVGGGEGKGREEGEVGGGKAVLYARIGRRHTPLCYGGMLVPKALLCAGWGMCPLRAPGVQSGDIVCRGTSYLRHLHRARARSAGTLVLLGSLRLSSHHPLSMLALHSVLPPPSRPSGSHPARRPDGPALLRAAHHLRPLAARQRGNDRPWPPPAPVTPPCRRRAPVRCACAPCWPRSIGTEAAT